MKNEHVLFNLTQTFEEIWENLKVLMLRKSLATAQVFINV